uniref:Non-specific lipid-transfer protein n=1 Tax=Nepenthes mirabilis TaxID=150983 RepID=A0A140GMM9_NEPMI|nr:putative lipid-transfer protein 2 [Nepenthes mirabilis]
MASSVLFKVACLVLICMLVAAPQAAATITCGQVVQYLLPCLSYLRNGGRIPPRCCPGVRGLNSAARTTPDRQAACNCLKTAARSYRINYGNGAALPGKCGVSIGFKIALNTDCSKVH